jgi:uncharacterized lipoprotein
MKIARLLICLPLSVSLGACSIHHMFERDCHAPQEYERAVQVPPLRVPAGIDAPDVQGALVIPAEEIKAPPPKATDACLDLPPQFKEPPPARAAAP